MAKILIVDRDPQIRKLLRTLLVRAGHEVHATHHPEIALQMCAPPGAFDLLLTGLRLPTMDGHELARSVAAKYPGMRVLLVTGTDSECDDCPYSPRCAIIPKPFTPKMVIERVAEALKSRGR